jgi:hypothetical protein
MSFWRTQKRQARETVHETMQVEAKYIVTTGAAPVDVSVRLHTKFDALGNLRGAGYAEMQSIKPKAIFLRPAAGFLQNNAVLWVAPGEAYAINNIQPPDDITVTVELTKLTPKQYAAEGLPDE